MEYATLALHLAELSAIPSIPLSTTTNNPLPQDTTGSGKSTHTLNTITTMYTPHTLHHMHSMNTIHSAMSHSGPCNITPFMNAPVVMDAEQSEESITHHECSPCPACEHKKARSVEVCCGWWPSASKATTCDPVPPDTDTDEKPTTSVSNSARVDTAVSQALSKHFPAPALSRHSHFCALHKTTVAPEDAVLHALLHPSESSTSKNVCTNKCTLMMARHLLSTGSALAVVVLLELHTNDTVETVHTVTVWSLLSLAFRALGDIDSTTCCVRQALQLYTEMTTNDRSEDISLLKCEVLHMCASHLALAGRYAIAVIHLDLCSELVFQAHGELSNAQLEKCWCLLLSGEFSLAQEVLMQLSGVNCKCSGFSQRNYEDIDEKVRELALLLKVLHAGSTEPFLSTELSGYNNGGVEWSERHQHCMSVLRSFESIANSATGSSTGVIRSLLSIKAQLANALPARLLSPINMSIVEWISHQMESVESIADNVTTFESLYQLCTTTCFTTLSSAVVFCISIFTNMKHYADWIARTSTLSTTIEHNNICEILVLVAYSMMRCHSLTKHSAPGLRPLYTVLSVQFELLLAKFYERFCFTDQASMHTHTSTTAWTYVTHITTHLRLQPLLPVRKSSIIGVNTATTLALLQSTARLSRQNASVGRKSVSVSSEQECTVSVHSLSNSSNSGCATGPGLTKQKVLLWKGVLSETNSIDPTNNNESDTCALIRTCLNDQVHLEKESAQSILVNTPVPAVNPVYKQFRTYVSSQIDALEM